MKPLYPFQKDAIEFLISNKRAILSLDTGLGKTRVCIETALEISTAARVAPRRLQEDTNVLVICPAFLKTNWAREVDKWGGDVEGLVWRYESYAALSRPLKGDLERYLKERVDLIVADEAHYLKNPSSKRSQRFFKGVLPFCDRVVLSTATPYVRSASDLWTLFKVCEPDNWGTYKQFCETFCEKQWNPYSTYYGNQWVYKSFNPKRASELKKSAKRFLFRKKKKDVLRDLPDKVITDLYVTAGDIDVEDEAPLPTVMEAIGQAKYNSVMELESEFGDRALVIFTKHKKLAREISTVLDCKCITGDTSIKARQKAIDEFQNNMSKRLVATMGACGVGVNLTAADTAIFAELPWSYAELKQCEDRLHRIGQVHNCVHIYRVIAEDTYDETAIDIINDKIDGEHLTVEHFE